jgi:hypothetical protein
VIYEITLPTDTQREIVRYLRERFTGIDDQIDAYRLIRAEIDQLAVNPMLGMQYFGGPFELRRVYRFSFAYGTTRFRASVVYKILESDKIVVVSGFSAMAL